MNLKQTVRAVPEKSREACVFCGAGATTRDHIPSRNLFPETMNLELRTVPSCEVCNKGFSEDEVFFRDLITGLALDKSISAYSLFESKIRRSIRRRPQLARHMFSKMKVVNLKTPGGIYLGKKTVIKVEKEDWNRIYNVLGKTIRGLTYLEFGCPLPSDYQIYHRSINGPKLEKSHPDLLKSMEWRAEETKHVFLYGLCSVPNSFNSVWITQYFGTVVFLSFVMNDELRKLIERGGEK